MNIDQSVRPQPRRREGLIEHTASIFREEIARGAWPVGQRIPTEPALVSEYGVGRNTVREAVQSLVQAGLLQREQGRGTFVISDSELASVLERQLTGGTRHHYLELRLSLDSAGASLAAKNRSDADIEVLRELRAQREDAWAVDDPDLRASADVVLHNAIIAATHNPLYVKLYESMLELFTAHMRDEVSEDEEAAHRHHHDLVEAIAEGDADRATAAVVQIFAPFMT